LLSREAQEEKAETSVEREKPRLGKNRAALRMKLRKGRVDGVALAVVQQVKKRVLSEMYSWL